MREILFSVSTRPDGSLIGENAAMRIAISGLDRDDLHHEAREALIRAVGPAHVSYRVRLAIPQRSVQCLSTVAMPKVD
jgi:hypothetical protein